jgi:hypothetical protein
MKIKGSQVIRIRFSNGIVCKAYIISSESDYMTVRLATGFTHEVQREASKSLKGSRTRTMEHTRHGYTMNVFKTDGGWRVIVTKPNGSKIFDFAFSEKHAWALARQHAGF